MSDELTHCSFCGRKLRKRTFSYATPAYTRWLGHAADRCDESIGPKATAQQVKEAKARYKERTGKDWTPSGGW